MSRIKYSQYKQLINDGPVSFFIVRRYLDFFVTFKLKVGSHASSSVTPYGGTGVPGER